MVASEQKFLSLMQKPQKPPKVGKPEPNKPENNRPTMPEPTKPTKPTKMEAELLKGGSEGFERGGVTKLEAVLLLDSVARLEFYGREGYVYHVARSFDLEGPFESLSAEGGEWVLVATLDLRSCVHAESIYRWVWTDIGFIALDEYHADEGKTMLVVLFESLSSAALVGHAWADMDGPDPSN